jgi:hypothetical protein
MYICKCKNLKLKQCHPELVEGKANSSYSLQSFAIGNGFSKPKKELLAVALFQQEKTNRQSQKDFRCYLG